MGLVRVTCFFEGRPVTTYMPSDRTVRSVILWALKKNKLNTKAFHAYAAFPYGNENDEAVEIPWKVKLKNLLAPAEGGSPSSSDGMDSVALAVRTRHPAGDLGVPAKVAERNSVKSSISKQLMRRIGDFFSVTKSTRLDRTPSSKTFRKLFGSPLRRPEEPNAEPHGCLQFAHLQTRPHSRSADQTSGKDFLAFDEVPSAWEDECRYPGVVPGCIVDERSFLLPLDAGAHFNRLPHAKIHRPSFKGSTRLCRGDPFDEEIKKDGKLQVPPTNTSTPAPTRRRSRGWRREEADDEFPTRGEGASANKRFRDVERGTAGLMRKRRMRESKQQQRRRSSFESKDESEDDASEASFDARRQSNLTVAPYFESTSPVPRGVDSEVSSVWASPSPPPPTGLSVSCLSPVNVISDAESDSVFQVTGISLDLEAALKKTPNANNNNNNNNKNNNYNNNKNRLTPKIEPKRRFFNDLVF